MASAAKKKLVSVGRLLRRSTLQDHVTIDELKMPADAGQKVELFKLRQSFENFLAPPETMDATKVAGVNPASVSSVGHDIFVSLPRAELVELQPTPSGWYAVFLVDKTAKTAIETFVHAGRRHFKETNMFGGFVSPFSTPTVYEAAHTRLHIKVSDYCGKLMHTTFCDAQGDVLFSPGDDILHLHAKPKLGLCSLTVHLAGYWYDCTKQGPLLYLAEVHALGKEADPGLNLPPTISEQSPGGTVFRRELKELDAPKAAQENSHFTEWQAHSATKRMEDIKREYMM